MRFLPVNVDALIVELNSLEQTMALTDVLQGVFADWHIEEIIPAARTVLIRYNPITTNANTLAKHIAQLDISASVMQSGELVTIPVRYNGEDLSQVADYLGITVAEVIARHTNNEYQVAFCGFAPGFAYMVSKTAQLNVPRRQSPRVRIPAGSVALAGEFSSVYPQASPGGWQLIGITDTAVWNIYRDEPALFKPGTRVHFVDASQSQTTYYLPKSKKPDDFACQQQDITVLATGLQTLFQDNGRVGQATLGISESGAMDKSALHSANRVVGNPINEPALEITQGGFSAQINSSMLVAVTGALCEITITTAKNETYTAPMYQPIQLESGDIIRLGNVKCGVRSYFAVRGGFQVAPILTSCSFDTLAQVGPLPLKVGQTLAVKQAKVLNPVSLTEIPVINYPTGGDVVVLDIVLGPRTDWFTQQAVELLISQLWQVTPASNRIGLRLSGERSLSREKQQELPSEGTCIGAIQIPANGQPVLFLNDHPLTGGYPVIGAVCKYHLDLAGQIPVNAKIKFNPIGMFKEFEGSDVDHV
ncbi:sensor histidine kinase inhibitor, KipI family [Gilliamella bombicola]|uniref:Sensor histidine kinase inhibitor, KipI family n=1 Tax=Gilliamella bombicola TaxID=1798182 RepID=A0A1C4AUD1_9GAMM|nr:5-oxoprolinase/urea amidolyase family protein [Gilliamella bombicola]SCB98174.1 sensor histidine kinase inhibitor, KipI family [Gilliamella bombicola]